MFWRLPVSAQGPCTRLDTGFLRSTEDPLKPNKGYLRQVCGVGVEAGVGVDWSRPFGLESESELELAKLFRLRLQSGVAENLIIDDNCNQ